MKNSVLIFILSLCATACVQNFGEDHPSPTTEVPADMANFDFKTTNPVTLEITALDNGDKPLHDIPFQVGFKLDSQFVSLMDGVTVKSGKVVFSNLIPSFVDQLVIKTDYLGLVNETTLQVQSGANTITLGGASRTPNERSTSLVDQSASGSRTSATGFTFLSTFDSNGVPNNLEPVNDYIPQDLLDIINSSLPESKPVPTNNPQYLDNDIDTDTHINSDAEVWVTFVAEGAGYRNALGYYTYDLANPPATVDDIKSMKIIFPNVSLPGSGGNLKPGSKVSLGVFPANTGIGWFLIPDGWNGTTDVMKSGVKYSTKALNTFTSLAYHQHTVLLNDPNRELLLLGMEDVSRPGGDNDFNDAVFYVTANPYSAITTKNLVETKQSTGLDTDGDGVLDKNDKYPTDAQKAFDIYTPGAGIFGSLAFEDQWPSKGDYDMNDLVVDYNFKLVANTANAVVEIQANLVVKAVGAAYQNGFGIELPVSPSKVSGVTGTRAGKNIDLSPNGTEANQKKAVIIAFENASALFNTTGFVNTKETEPYFEPVSLNVVIRFTEPIKMVDLGYVPFNPFVIINGERGREVHLADFEPTSLAKIELLGTSADSSKPTEGRYYKASNNMPWAINVALPIEYPQESRPVNESFTKFSPWAQSGGINYKDWYNNLSSTYRQPSLIYKKK